MKTHFALKAALLAAAVSGISACASDKKEATAAANPVDVLTQRVEKAEYAAMEAQRQAADAQRSAAQAQAAADEAKAAAEANNTRVNRAFEKSQQK